MATHNVSVDGWGIGHIETDCGRLYYGIAYFNAPITAGDTYIITEGRPKYIGRGSIWHYVEPPDSWVVTEFSTPDGRFTATTPSGGTGYVLKIDNTVVASGGGTGPFTNKLFGTNIWFVVGTNDVAAYWNESSYYPTTEGVSNIDFNTVNEIGSCHVEDMMKGIEETIDTAGISLGNYILEHGENPPQVPDPYWEGGDSEDYLGGDTDFDQTSDTITDSSLPTISAADTGFTRIYNPTLSQVQALANYLWTDPSIVNTLWNHVKQFLENPMDAFIAFNLVPCVVTDGGTAEFKVMYIGTGVSLTTGKQFADVDCGSVTIQKMYDSALDYSPYTRVSMFLPYIGSVELNCDEVMGKTLSVTYRIDVVSGGCVAKIAVDGSIRYQYSGHCAITIPFTSADFTGYVSAIIQASKMVASLAAGPAGMPELAATIAGTLGQKSGETVTTTTRALNPDTGRMRNVAQTKEEHSGTKASFSALAKSGIGNTVGAVIGSKPVVERSGSFSGNTGYLGVRRPYVIIERPRMCKPEQYGKYNGRPSMIYASLGSLTGYTVVQEVQLTGFTATNPELDEIGSFLKGGVIL